MDTAIEDVIELAKARNGAIDDGNVGAETGCHLRCMQADDAATEHCDFSGNTPGTPPSSTPRPPLAFCRAVAPAWIERRPATSDIGASRGSPPRSSVTVS